MSHVTAGRVEFVRRSWPAHARQLAPIRAEIRRWLVPLELTFWTEYQTVCIEIVDHGHWQPPAAISSSRRRGFAIMSQLMQAVLVHYDIRGTRVLLRRAA